MDETLDARHSAWRWDLEGELPWMQELACHLVRDRETARDLVQDVWLMALERPPRLRDRPRAWLSTVMRNLVRQDGRRTRRRGRVQSDGRELGDDRPRPDQELARVELEALLQSELARLPEPFRATLRDHFLRGLTSAQIARRDGTPAGTVRWRLKTGLERLRAQLDERCGGRNKWIGAFVGLARGENRPLPEPSASVGTAVARVGSVSLAGVAMLVGGTLLLDRLAPERALGTTHGSALEVPAVASLPDAPPPLTEPPEILRPAETAPLLALESLASSTPGAPTGSLLELRVTHAEGVAVAGAELRVATRNGYEARGTSDEVGFARIALEPDDVGALGIRAAREHVAVRAFARGHAASRVLFVPHAFEATEPLRLSLGGRERVLGGRATDEQGRALVGVDVFALSDPHHSSVADVTRPFLEPLALGTRTGEDGLYEIEGLSEGEQILCIRRPGHETLVLPVSADETRVELRLGSGSTIRGRILDERGNPAQGARVWVEPLYRGTDWCAGIPGFRPDLRGFGLETLTDADGCYELAGVHARVRRVYARSSSDPSCVANGVVTVAARSTVNWSAFLQREAGLRVRLVDEDHRPCVDWVVRFSSVPSAGARWARSMVSDAQGRVEVFEAASEADIVVYDESGQGQPWATRRVQPAAEEELIVLHEDRFGFLAGRLAHPDGTVPAQGHLMAYKLTARFPVPIPFDASTGRFRARLQPGTYTLLLHGGSGGGWLAKTEVVKGERARLGRLSPPPVGELRLRADDFGSRQGNYRLELCFGRSSMKWKEGSLPLAAEGRVHAGLYRLDASGPDAVLRSGWVQVREDGVAELDLEQLPSLLVEVIAPRSTGGPVALTVEGTQSVLAPGEPVRQLSLSRRIDGRIVHALCLPAGRWKLSAQLDSGASAEARVEVGGEAPEPLVLDLAGR